MKSLKRTLSLVLALVMVLGLFGGISMTAAASDFTDDEEIRYKEAVDVMTGIGAINGYEEGDSFSFKPKGTITRAEAAKLVTYTILGEAAAKRLTGLTTRYTDVDVNDYAWAIPSIEYLAGRGILDGRGDGIFDPGGEITGYEVGKMLLCALGYGVKGEYKGTGWDLNVALDGNKPLGLPDDEGNKLAVFSGRDKNSVEMSKPATREEVALYCFNTIQISQVEYISTLDLYATYSNSLSNKLGSIQTNIYPTLREIYGRRNSYGRPVTAWTYRSEDICEIADTPILTYTTAVSTKALDVAIKNLGYSYRYYYTNPDPTKDSYWVTNAELDDVVTYTNNVYTNDVDTLAGDSEVLGGKGTLLEVYGDPITEAVDKIVLIETELAVVTKIIPDDPATTKIDERALELATIPTDTGTPATKFVASVENKTDGFDAAYEVAKTLDDAGQTATLTAIVNDSSNTAIAVGIPETVEGKVSLVTCDTTNTQIRNYVLSFVMDGKTYEIGQYAVRDGAKDPLTNVNDLKVDFEVTALLDSYGYVLAVQATNKANNYAVVVAVDNETALFGKPVTKAKLITSTGEELVVSTTLDATALTASQLKYPGHIVTYTAAKGANAGKFDIKIHEEIAGISGKYDAIATTDNTAINVATGRAAVQVQTAKGSYDEAIANNETIYILKDADGAYTAYVGVNSVPSMVGNAGCVIYTTAKAADNDGITVNYAKVVFVNGGEITGGGKSGIAYMVVNMDEWDEMPDDLIVRDAAIIEGSDIKNVKIDEKLLPLGFFGASMIKSYTLSDDNIITDVKLIETGTESGNTKTGSGAGISRTSKELIKLDTANIGSKAKDHTYEDDCVVWEIDPSKPADNGRFTSKKITQVADSATDQLVWIENKDTGKVSALYVIKNTAPVTQVNATAKFGAGDIGTTPDTSDVILANNKWGAGATKLVLSPGFTYVKNDPSDTTVVPDGVLDVKWLYSADDGKTWKELEGTNGNDGYTVADVDATTNADINKAGLYRFRCVATPKQGAAVKVTSGVGEISIYVNGVKYAAPTVAAGTDSTHLEIVPDAAGSITTGTMTVTVTVKKPSVTTGTLTPTVTAKSGTPTVQYAKSDNASLSGTIDGSNTSVTVNTGDTYVFTISNITDEITTLTFGLS